MYVAYGQALISHSDCAAGQFNIGIGVLDCVGCPTQVPANLLTTSCTSVPVGQYSCCGAISYFSSNTTCSTAEVKICSLCPAGQFSASGSTPCMPCSTPGKFSYAGGIVCDFCPPGRFNAGALGVCDGCPVGTYSAAIGATESTTCTPCSSSPAQLVSVQGSSSCSTGCPAGYYSDASNTCTSCSAGNYQPIFGQKKCVQCDAGTYLSTTGQTSSLNCINCSLGSQSSAGASSCMHCSAGQYGINNSAGKAMCVSCPAGRFSDISGSDVIASCFACSEGKYSPGLGASCASCAVGRYLTTTGSVGSSSCVSCPPGTASLDTGVQSLSSCVKCPRGRFSPQGSSNCPFAYVDRYLSTAAALSATTPDLRCPSNALCRGGLATPRPMEGYWSSHASLEWADQILACDRNTCKGAADFPNAACWELESFASAACQDGGLTCSEGAYGPLCGSCRQGFTFSASTLICSVCVTIPVQAYIAAGLMGALGLTALALNVWWDRLPLWARESLVVRTLRYFDKAKCKIAWSTYQIIGSVSVTLSVEWPPAFREFLESLSILSFDFLPLDCIGDNPSFYRTVIIWTIAPVVVSGVLGLSLATRLVQAHARSSSDDARESAQMVYGTHLNYFLVLSYLVLPVVLMKQFQALDCVEIAGRRYVQVDTSIDCDSTSSHTFRILDGLFIAFYLGIPALWLILLCRRRTELNPAPNDLRFALFLRDRNDSLKSLRVLYDIYLPKYYYFEVVEMGRRVGLVGVVPLMSDLASRRACFGLGFSLCGWALYREIEPFRNEQDNSLNYVAQVVISLTYGAALVIATGLNEGMDLLAFGAVLVSINISVLILALLLAYAHWRSLQAEKAAKFSKRATKVEYAVPFNKLKFRTTFDALENNELAISECLVFWYCSLADAEFVLQRGIPASEVHNGIVLSLHRPHQLDEFDRAHFAERSAVVVAALPRRLLRAPFSDLGPHLRLLPAETLRALRSSFFHDLIDPELWHAGEVFFPPLKIARVFQLLPDTDRPQDVFMPLRNVVETKLFDGAVYVPKTCADFVEKMQAVRKVCDKHAWVPLYHYTDAKWTRNIIEGGFRMSTQGQGDGGVYFSVRGPTSYGIGTDKYEANIIADCFGAGRMHEYLGKHMLDVVFVYGMEVGALTQAPGGRNNAFMVSKGLFELLSLPAPEGSFFLRPDRILGVFLIGTNACLPGLEAAKDGIESERCLDFETKDAIAATLREMDKGDAALAGLLEALKQAEHALETQDGTDHDIEATRLATRLSSTQEKAYDNRVSLISRFRLSSQPDAAFESASAAGGRNFSMSNPPKMRSISRPEEFLANSSNYQNIDSAVVWSNPMVLAHQRSSMRDGDSVVTSHNAL